MKLAIVGDSFATDWSVKYPNCKGWPNMLSEIYNVTNLAQAGCSEYKILKQLKTIKIENFDLIIVSHTIFDRIHTLKHPVHHNDSLHNQCDLIFSDIEYHNSTSSTNTALTAAYDFFKYHYDENFYKDIYKLIFDEIDRITSGVPTLHISHFDNINVDINFYKVYKKHNGLINHYSAKGNRQIFESIHNYIKEKYNGKTI
jgi:hypothetical protein